MPAAPKSMCVRMTITARRKMICQWAEICAGATIIPTETKNMAPKRFLIGSTILSICSLSIVSARIDPITNAPRAEENPTEVARATIPKQSPMLTISRISSLRYFFAFSSRVGMMYIPTKNQSMRKNSSLAMFMSISLPSNCWETAMVDSNTISTMAIRSSTTRVPKTIPAHGLSFMPMSWYDFRTTIVEDIERRPARNMLSSIVQPSACPVAKPITKTPRNFVNAVTIALDPTFISFLKLNSRPRPNIMKIIPISDHCWTVSVLDIPGKKCMLGPMRNPAMI